jgi:DNA-binding CsgD family transcriptional regulator
MDRDLVRATRTAVERIAGRPLDWVALAMQADELLRDALPHTRSCWHTVDPGTVLFTGSLNRDVGCSGSWLATHEYVVDDVNKWWFLARSGRLAGATSLATHGDLSRSARHRSHTAYGIGDELRVSFVVDGLYWGAVGFLREHGQPWFTELDIQHLAALSETLARAFRRALVTSTIVTPDFAEDAPGVVVFDADGEPESVSPSAERWAAQMVEIPEPATAAESKMIRAVAARARALAAGQDPLQLAARSRVQTRSGQWLLLYGTPLSRGADGGEDGGPDCRTAVIIQPAAPREIAPLMALAYGLTDRERQITALCIRGSSTKEIARSLAISAYTVQDHLKAIFDKTGVRSRGELVGQIFLEHYVPLWEQLPESPGGWHGFGTPQAP